MAHRNMSKHGFPVVGIKITEMAGTSSACNWPMHSGGIQKAMIMLVRTQELLSSALNAGKCNKAIEALVGPNAAVQRVFEPVVIGFALDSVRGEGSLR